MEDPWSPSREGGGVFCLLVTAFRRRPCCPSRLHTDEFNIFVFKESSKHTDGIGPTSDARNDNVRQLSRPDGVPPTSRGRGCELSLIEHLGPRLLADDGLEVPDDVREGMRSDCRPDNVVGGSDVRHPISESLIDCILQCLGSRRYRYALGPQHAHSEHVEFLPLAVLSSHVDDALESQESACSGRGNSVLSRPCLSDDSLLSEFLCEECLSKGVIDLMCSCVGKFLPLEPDLRPPCVLRQSLCMIQRGGTSHIISSQEVQLCCEGRVRLGCLVHLCQLVVSVHQSFRNVPTTKVPKTPHVCTQSLPSPIDNSSTPVGSFCRSVRLQPLCRRFLCSDRQGGCGLQALCEGLQRCHLGGRGPGGVLDTGNDCCAHNETIGSEIDNALDVLRFGDSKPNRNRHV
mmetsp:Transcript_38445/g.75479  ORF Transcript_38445/g.75479 Transcript_38445/m.75479 type:complete len:402 (-) Transcript_38445:1119-2324(-)